MYCIVLYCIVLYCIVLYCIAYYIGTVDGRNPAPVDMVNISLFAGLHTCQVVSRISSINRIIVGIMVGS